MGIPNCSNSVNLLSPKQSLRVAYKTILIMLIASGGLFYYWQNYAGGLGGKIALPKLFWLACALWFWYFLPLLVGLDVRIGRLLRRVYWILLANMVLRAAIELWMMYLSQNWHPYWGIAHDLFSAVLILVLGLRLRPATPLDRAVRRNFQVSGWMFWLESYFAWYFFNAVHSSEQPIYFVPATAQHSGILWMTWLAVIALVLQQFRFALTLRYIALRADNGS